MSKCKDAHHVRREGLAVVLGLRAPQKSDKSMQHAAARAAHDRHDHSWHHLMPKVIDGNINTKH